MSYANAVWCPVLRLAFEATRGRGARERAAAGGSTIALCLNLSSAAAQLSVLIETVEALQAAKPAHQHVISLSMLSDNEGGRIANLVARISALKAGELQLRLRSAEVEQRAEDRTWQCGQVRTHFRRAAIVQDKSGTDVA
eukprot:2164084-Rhodomonas_salina.1